MSIGLQAQSREATAAPAGARIAFCVAEPLVRQRLTTVLEAHDWQVAPQFVESTHLDATIDETWDCVLIDLPSVDSESTEVVRRLASRCPDLSVVVAVSESEITHAPTLLQSGAAAFVCRDGEAESVVSAAVLAGMHGRLRRDVRKRDRSASDAAEVLSIVGCSPAIRRLTGVIERAGDNDATVLIEGRPGVGKSLIAQLVHTGGRRAGMPLVTLHAQDTDEATLERALLDADRGTLLINSVETFNAGCQSRLVKFLKDRIASGGRRDVRIVATTSAKLAELTAKGAFREDLYYRLNMFPIVIPTLQERREDIPLLASHFLKQSSRRHGFPDKGFTAPAMIMLEAHPWPGNVAQLRNSVLRAHALAEGGPIDRVHLFGPSTGVEPPPGVVGLSDDLRRDDDEDPTENDILPFHEEERRLLTRALRATKGNVRRAAQLLAIGRATLYRKIQVYQLRLQ